MINSMQHLKIDDLFICRMRVDHARIKSQVELVDNTPTSYFGETLKSAMRIILWHLNEQAEQIDQLEGKAKRLNKLIDQANEILIEEDARTAFTEKSYEVLAKQDERLQQGENND